ncbi:hypothetical protein DEJ50_23595 [Streptomyces venezuelae]|uniref:Uncharacterized protein n=1 Tax=Streptomyces venezuelae TaxID=54571 RepID=A0A5P2DB86_STRVZ|nr:DUF5336 domain-containing protein [Streptomyces venezuelae]QES50359.1 hypothetical protein DEJ50_23595 [Streptomyces venezuelae]
MNIRSLTRGDGVVIGAAVLLFIASLLDYYSADGFDAPSAWDTDVYGLVLPTIFLLGFVAAGMLIGGRFLPEGRKLAGIPLTGWGTVLAVASAWSALWALILSPDRVDLGAGAIISLLAALLMAGVAIAGPKVGALAGPLLPAASPAAVPPYGGQPGQYPGQPGQPGAGYGYPGGQQPYGATPQPVPPYGGQGQDTPAPAPAPAPGPQDAQPQPQAQQPQQAQPQPQPAADFAPFWFAVPVARPLFPEDGSPNPIAELAPGTWYLAVDQRGPQALVAQTQDGRRGVLNDTSGIQRG